MKKEDVLVILIFIILVNGMIFFNYNSKITGFQSYEARKLMCGYEIVKVCDMDSVKVIDIPFYEQFAIPLIGLGVGPSAEGTLSVYQPINENMCDKLSAKFNGLIKGSDQTYTEIIGRLRGKLTSNYGKDVANKIIKMMPSYDQVDVEAGPFNFKDSFEISIKFDSCPFDNEYIINVNEVSVDIDDGTEGNFLSSDSSSYLNGDRSVKITNEQFYKSVTPKDKSLREEADKNRKDIQEKCCVPG